MTRKGLWERCLGQIMASACSCRILSQVPHRSFVVANVGAAQRANSYCLSRSASLHPGSQSKAAEAGTPIAWIGGDSRPIYRY